MDFWFTGKNERHLSYPEHFHGYWEILFHLEGSGIMRIDTQEFPFSPGSIFCIRPGIKHSKHSQSGFLDGSILLRDFFLSETTQNVLIFQDDDAGSLQTLYQLGTRFSTAPTGNVYDEQFLRCILDAIQNLLCRWQNARQSNSEIARFQAELALHATDPDFDLNAAFGVTHYSPNHLRTLFHTQCGCTPVQYLNRLRIQQAKQQLLQSSGTLTTQQIARNCGFRDPYYFSRVFKQVTGLSPSHFCEQSKRLEPDRLASDMAPEDYPSFLK